MSLVMDVECPACHELIKAAIGASDTALRMHMTAECGSRKPLARVEPAPAAEPVELGAPSPMPRAPYPSQVSQWMRRLAAKREKENVG